MQEFEKLIEILKADPTQLGASFHNPLTYQEEMLLIRMDADLARQMDRMLERALGGNGPEILVHEEQRVHILELAALRNSIIDLLQNQGTIPFTGDCSS